MLLNCGVGEDSWESLRTARRSNQSILKEISPEYSLEGLRLKVKFQYFGNLMAKNWLIRKDPDAGNDWRQEEKGMTEDEMVGWHHWLDEHEFENAPGVGDGQWNLGCCSPWDGRVRHHWVTELNWYLHCNTLTYLLLVNETQLLKKLDLCANLKFALRVRET